MRLTKVTTMITSLNVPGEVYEALFLVDTGAADCMLPSDKLEQIGVERKGKMSYELADSSS